MTGASLKINEMKKSIRSISYLWCYGGMVLETCLVIGYVIELMCYMALQVYLMFKLELAKKKAIQISGQLCSE